MILRSWLPLLLLPACLLRLRLKLSTSYTHRYLVPGSKNGLFLHPLGHPGHLFSHLSPPPTVHRWSIRCHFPVQDSCRRPSIDSIHSFSEIGFTFRGGYSELIRLGRGHGERFYLSLPLILVHSVPSQHRDTEYNNSAVSYLPLLPNPSRSLALRTDRLSPAPEMTRSHSN